MGRMATLARLAGVGALLGSFVGGIAGATAAGAAQSTDEVTCDGLALTIRTNNNHSSDNGGWSSVQLVDSDWSGHLTPVSFSGTAFDETIGETIFQFSSLKGGGNANQNQEQVTCTQEFTATMADLLEPGDELPPGTSLTDVVTFTFTAVVVHHG